MPRFIKTDTLVIDSDHVYALYESYGYDGEGKIVRKNHVVRFDDGPTLTIPESDALQLRDQLCASGLSSTTNIEITSGSAT